MTSDSSDLRADLGPGDQPREEAGRPADGRPALAIGPANYAGQAYRWAVAVRERTPYDAWSFTYGEHDKPMYYFVYPSDRFIGAPQLYLPHARARRVDAAIAGATHVALDGFERLYRLPGIGNVRHDAGVLGRRGLHIALISHGSDTRDPDHHQARNPHSYFGASEPAYVRKMIKRSARNRAFAQASGLPLFVSTPDLLWDLPQATWLPVTVDAAVWWTTEPVLEHARPRVVHLPSRRTPPTKGTHLVTPAMERLAADGIIDYTEPEKVAHADVPAVIAGADVIIDQITGDAYGTAGAEAMAAGRLVLAGLHGTRAKMPEDPPIVDVSPDTIADVVRDIAAHPENYRARAHAGPGFVERWHDGRVAAAALAGFLGDTP